MTRFPPRAFERLAAEPRPAPHPAAAPANDLLPISPPALSAPRFLSLRDVLTRLTISRSLLYELIKDPVQPFPAPVHIGRRSVWVAAEVEAYMEAVIAQTRAAMR